MIRLAVNPNLVERSYKFSCEIIRHQNQFNRFGRSENVQIIRTHVGKLAELLFLQYLKDNKIESVEGDMFTIYQGAENADDFDFVLPNGQSIDIKTASKSFHRRIMIPLSQFHLRKDYYVGIKLNFNTDQVGNIMPREISDAILHGYATREMFENSQTMNYGEGNCKSVLLSSLLPINNLLALYRQ